MINENTKAIVAVHCFGHPCDVHKLKEISNKYNLPIIYDAAHAFGIKLDNESLFKYGDISIGSLHATKVFHSIEGGICVVNNNKYSDKLKAIKNYGYVNGLPEYVGVNAKPSEFHAAMGICLLNHFDEIIERRKEVYNLYRELLNNKLYIPEIQNNLEYNYIYFPVLFESEEVLLETLNNLNKENIYPRRYFYPCLNELPMFDNNYKTPIASDISKRILCLPIDTYISKENVERICQIINETISSKVYKL